MPVNGSFRQKLPFGVSRSNFRFPPESRLKSEIEACPRSANSRRAVLPLLEEPCPSNLGRRPLVDFGKHSVEASQTAKARSKRNLGHR